MSLNIPYPSLVFVPLDVLTAEELNNLMSNITYIANEFPLSAANLAANSVTKAKIAPSAVGSSNIDWPTMYVKTAQDTSQISISPSAKVLVSVSIADLPVGAKVLVLGQSRGTGDATSSDFTLRINDGLENTVSGIWWKSLHVSAIVERTSSVNKVDLKAISNTTGYAATNSQLIVIRVA